jgi:hypothetical protein
VRFIDDAIAAGVDERVIDISLRGQRSQQCDLRGVLAPAAAIARAPTEVVNNSAR